jgi:superfamily II DNA or RNA helicase
VTPATAFKPGDLVKARGREWVVLPEQRPDVLRLRPLGGSDDDATLIYVPIEPEPPTHATFSPPDPTKPGDQTAAVILRDALRLKLRAGAGPFRSIGNIAFEPRAYQLVPLLMALKLDPIRLLIADDVGIGKTIEAGLIARELLDRGEIQALTVICPPHLCEQWRAELRSKFSVDAEVVRAGTAARLERGLRADESIFDAYPFTVVSLDYIKSDRRREDFLRACPDFVIVDEAHTCVQASHTATRHQRYQLLKGLADKKNPPRHMLLLTATPHSGDDEAFHNLLGLLEPRFAALRDMAESAQRAALRDDLSNQFVQRQRVDIDEWKDAIGFPKRETLEKTYKLTGGWGELFDDILKYARTLVDRSAQGTALEQRMSWWAALALLRCASSSPASAAIALRTRLKAATDMLAPEQLRQLDLLAAETVMDGDTDEDTPDDESVPAGSVDSTEDVEELKELIARAEGLRGPKRDPKLDALIEQLTTLIAEGYKPVVFCRYIATANYVAEQLAQALKEPKTKVLCVTGELNPDQRQEKIAELEADESEDATPVLIATDCLSEGVNLQNYFDAVVHYDLTWNPTRHEQRAGRVDRFGQSKSTVRALMLYGENNPVDGAVLRVILRKAEKIRKELGVAVPVPTDTNKIVEAIMKAVLFQGGGRMTQELQLRLDLGEAEKEVDDVWTSAKDRERATRTRFAQRRLKPSEVLPEWHKTTDTLGGEADVDRFVHQCAERLGAPLETRKGYFRFPILHLPKPLQERLEAIGITKTPRISFSQRRPAGVEHLTRSHPLVATIADYVAEQGLDADHPQLTARCGGMFTKAVPSKTTVLILRSRYHIGVEIRNPSGQFEPRPALLAEECIGVAFEGSGAPRVLESADALALLSLTPDRNMEPGHKTKLVREAIDALPAFKDALASTAKARAEQLLADHRRVREASDAKGLRYSVTPSLPVDVIGVYVLLPVAGG